MSLTAIPDNYEMWELYSNKGKGFCVGFKTISLFKLSDYFGSGGEVVYQDKLPIIKYSDSWEKKTLLQIYSKLKKWLFENEYRLTKYKIVNRQIKIPNQIVSDIIIGENMSDKMRKEIIQIVLDKFSDVTISIASFKNKSVTLTPFQI